MLRRWTDYRQRQRTALRESYRTRSYDQRPERHELSEEARRRQQQRFAEAIMREHPTAHHVRHPRVDRSTGIAVRPSRRSA